MTALLRFSLVGAANTLVGLAAILGLIALGVDDYRANLGGYAIGLALSFALNRAWTFGRRGTPAWREGGAFAATVALCYGANLGVLGAMRAIGFRESLIGQGAAMLAYSACFFLLSRGWVFRERHG